MKKWLFLAVVVLLIAGGTGYLAGKNNQGAKSPSEVVEDFFLALKEERYSDAEEYLSRGWLKELYSEYKRGTEELSWLTPDQGIRPYWSKGMICLVEIVDEKFSANNTAIIEVEICIIGKFWGYDEDIVYPETVSLVKKNNKWYITDFS